MKYLPCSFHPSFLAQSNLRCKPENLMGSARDKVHVVDSQSVAMALGFQALAVARRIEAGASLKDAIALAEKSHEYTGVFFAVDTLEFLHRGGRIGGAQRFIGSVLNMKPILAIQDGRVEGIERIRTKSKAQDRVLELCIEKSIAGRLCGLQPCMQMRQKMPKHCLQEQSRHSAQLKASSPKSAPRLAHMQDQAQWAWPSWQACNFLLTPYPSPTLCRRGVFTLRVRV